MFEILLIVAQCWLHDQSGRPASRPTSSLATVTLPEWSHATPVRADELPNDLPWLAPEKVAGTVDGVPPSPAILSAQGFKNAAGVFGSFFGGPLDVTSAPVDSRRDPKDLSPVTSEVAELITRWEQASSPVPRVFEFHRTRYDLSRQVETRSTGFFQYVSSDEGAWCFAEETAISNSVSYRKDAAGNRFAYEASSSKEWRWSKQEVLHVNHTSKTYAVAPLPKNLNGEPSTHFHQAVKEHVPFIIDVHGDVIRREWSLRLLHQNEYECYLEAIPRSWGRRREFNKCLIRLDAKSGRLTAIKYVDANQLHETVYVLDRCRDFSPHIIHNGRSLSRGVSLKGYVLTAMKWQ